VLAEHFRTAGLMHLLAVSGTNCVIIVGAVLLVLRRLRLGPVVCAVGSGLVLIAFVVVARPSPSVLRAATMSGIALIALGLACWPGPPLFGMLTYSAAVTLYLAYVIPIWLNWRNRRRRRGEYTTRATAPWSLGRLGPPINAFPTHAV